MNIELNNNGISTIHVGFVVDNGYVKYMAVTITSILKNTQNEVPLCFHVIHDGSISEENIGKINALRKIRGFTINWYSMNKQMHHEQRNDTRQDIPMVTNYRLLLGSILTAVDKIIFLDADLIVVDSLIELWQIDISDYYIGTTPSFGSYYDTYKTTLGISDNFSYCNTGVMLVNLQKWRDDNIEEKLIETEKKYRGLYQCYDQCIVNAALFDKMLYIGQEWNFRPQIWRKRRLKKKHPLAFMSPKIIHWATPVKPWKDRTIHYANKYYDYAKLTPFYEIIKSQRLPFRKIILQKIGAIYRKGYKVIRNPKIIIDKINELK